LRTRENQFGREQRTKFVSVSAVLRRAADEFVRPVEVPDEAGSAKTGDCGGREIEDVKRDFVRSFNFHATSMAEQVGHWLSKLKNKLGRNHSTPGLRNTKRSINFPSPFRLPEIIGPISLVIFVFHRITTVSFACS